MYSGTVLFITSIGVILTNLIKDEVSRELDPLAREMKAGEKEQVEMEKTLHKILIKLEKLEKKPSPKRDSDHGLSSPWVYFERVLRKESV